MYSTLISAAIAMVLSSRIQAAPLQSRQDASLTLADTVFFIAKTFGTNPNPAALPDVNNWLVSAVHSGAGQNTFTLNDPSTTSFNLSASGYFRNGTYSTGNYVTGGLILPDTPYSIVFDTTHQNSSSNPGAQAGFVEFDAGIGTYGIDVLNGQLTVTYASDYFYACPNIAIEGSEEIAVGVTDRYANPITGCWQILLYAQCAGNISTSNLAAFPTFQQATCYANATLAAGPDY